MPSWRRMCTHMPWILKIVTSGRFQAFLKVHSYQCKLMPVYGSGLGLFWVCSRSTPLPFFQAMSSDKRDIKVGHETSRLNGKKKLILFFLSTTNELQGGISQPGHSIPAAGRNAVRIHRLAAAAPKREPYSDM